jgi:hypothetical protein
MCSKKLRNIHRWERENGTTLLLILAVAINFIVGGYTLMDVVCAQKKFIVGGNTLMDVVCAQINLGIFIDGNVKMALSVR